MHSSKAKIALALSGLALALLFFAPSAVKADNWDLKTIFSVSHSFAVPGKVLEPNTKYVMRLLDLQGTRHVVQIFNEDQSELLTTFFAISDYRLDPVDETTFEFIEVEAGYPKPIRSWFYPGRLDGREFIYSKEQRAEIAAHAPGSRSVLTAQSTVDTEPVVESTDTVDTDADIAREKPMAVEPEPAVETVETVESVEIEEPVATEPQVTEPAPVQDADMDNNSAVDNETEERLPATAGELPLIGLIGTLCLGLGLGVRAFSSRS
jgi:hypothetical protein